MLPSLFQYVYHITLTIILSSFSPTCTFKTSGSTEYYVNNRRFAVLKCANSLADQLGTEAYIRHWLMRYYLDLVKIITRYEIIIA